MKTYSIGRDLGCDVVVNDTTDVVSRRHAVACPRSPKHEASTFRQG